MSALPVQALLFDIFGTVVDWREGIAREAQRCLAGRGIARDWHAFADRWRARYQPSMEAVRSGRRPFAKLDLLHRENLLATLEEFAIDGLSAAEIDQLTTAWHRLEPWPDVRDGMRRLRQRYLLAPVSNGNISLMVHLARHGGLVWDAILGAELARNYKPTPATYLAAADAFSLPAGACMMVAAHANDLLAARSCGLVTAYVHRPTEYGPAAAASSLPHEHRFEVMATSFQELADQLGC